jgi:hypothetical protein
MSYKTDTLTKLFSVLIIFSSCSAIRQGVALIRTPDRLIALNDTVHYENHKDSVFARQVTNALHVLIDSVEFKHYCSFTGQPKVYICNTIESFCKYTGSKYPGPRALTAPKGIYISPRLKGSSDWFDIVYHELSHSIMMQQLGIYRYRKLPVWFQEGLATYISNGGGSGNVTDSAAIFSLLQGQHFNPVARENVFSPNSFKNNEIGAWMLYRQSMLFVTFLAKRNEGLFEEVMRSIIKKESFSKAVEKVYGMNVAALWNNFVEGLRESEEEPGF